MYLVNLTLHGYFRYTSEFLLYQQTAVLFHCYDMFFILIFPQLVLVRYSHFKILLQDMKSNDA